jgi:hypothetical protein
MARISEPIIIHKRGKSFQFTLNSTCGLRRCVCSEWQCRSFKTLPGELFLYRNPKTKPEAKANAQILIAFLRKRLEAGAAVRSDVMINPCGYLVYCRSSVGPRSGVIAKTLSDT